MMANEPGAAPNSASPEGRSALRRFWRDARRSWVPISDDGARAYYNRDYALKNDAFAARKGWRDELNAALKEMKDAPEGDCLDFGCNTGRAIELLQCEVGAKAVVGVDINESALEICKKNWPYATFGLPKILNEQRFIGRFTRIVCSHVLGHVTDPAETLRLLARVAAPGARLAIITPNAWFARAMIAPNLWNRYQPDPTVLRYYTLGGLRSELSSNGWEVTAVWVHRGGRWFQRGAGERLFGERITAVCRSCELTEGTGES